MHWDARPLKDFEDQPLEELATRYDLVLIDYPFVGFAADRASSCPSTTGYRSRYLADQAAHSVGPSYASYTWAGKQWALAIDAACQVSAVRDDLWRAAELRRHAANLGGGRRARRAAARLSGPGCHSVQSEPCLLRLPFRRRRSRRRKFWPDGRQLDTRRRTRVARVSARARARPASAVARTTTRSGSRTAWRSTDEIVYVPLMFGYSSYARPGFRTRALRFGNAPRGPERRDRLGARRRRPGAVVAVAERDAAADLAREIASSAAQCGLYARAAASPVTRLPGTRRRSMR